MRTLSSLGAVLAATVWGKGWDPPARRKSPRQVIQPRSARGMERERLRVATAMRVKLEQRVERDLRLMGIWRLEEGEALAAFKHLPSVEAILQSASALAAKAA